MKIDIQFCMNFKKIGIFLFLIFIAFISGFLANMYDIYPSEIKEFYIANENSNENSKVFETDTSSLIHVTNDISKNEIKTMPKSGKIKKVIIMDVIIFDFLHYFCEIKHFCHILILSN